MKPPVQDQILAEMMEYYRQRAAEYDEWFYRRGRYDHGPEANARWLAEADEVFSALNGLRMTGDVLELAAGTGIWTERLVRTAATVTAIDASAEMIEINRARVRSDRVSYLLGDLFAWRPSRSYDGVCVAFWLSHVPLERLDEFLQTAASALTLGGKVFFVDNRRDPISTAHDQQLPGEETQVMTRRLNDGNEYQIVKNFFQPETLRRQFEAAGLSVEVRETATHFTYGFGQKV
jgi:demethylmenaquinone methyltransferase/2-methoxy-6-polyprenyl-1,4-benzoquinol methylase